MDRRITRPVAIMMLACMAAGCTTLREVPRDEYAARPDLRACRLWTRDGLVYDFDYARVSGDTLVGFRERGEGAPDDAVGSAAVALDDIERLTSRRIDWRRTSLIGGGVLAGILVASAARGGDSNPGQAGGGGLGGIDP